MRADADLMVYVGARWPALLRDAVRQGCPPERAAETVIDALSRCRRRWARASREEDVDQLVQDELGAAVGRGPRVPGSDVEREQAADKLLVLAPPSLEDLHQRQQQNDRRLVKRTAFVGLPLLLVAAGLSWWLSGDEPAPPPQDEGLKRAAVSRQENPAPGVTWYADGQLHLDHVVLAIEGLRDMTRIGTGVVYGDDGGRVVYVADDGTRTLLGHKDELDAVAASDENGWAAWVETGDEQPSIQVREADNGALVGEMPVDRGTRVVAVDGDAVYFVDASGAHALLPTSPSVIPVTPADLLDVRSRTRAFQLDDSTIQVVQSYFDVSFELPGRGAILSTDGNLVATRSGDAGEVTIFDTRSGEELQNGLREDDSTLAVAARSEHVVAYIVAPNGLTPGRELQLRTCDLRTAFCRIVARIPNLGGTPVLAR